METVENLNLEALTLIQTITDQLDAMEMKRKKPSLTNRFLTNGSFFPEDKEQDRADLCNFCKLLLFLTFEILLQTVFVYKLWET